MSESEEKNLRLLHEEERVAQQSAERGDYSKIVALLRKLHQPYEVPDLWFVADLLEDKPKRRAGRPADEKIPSSLKMLEAALMVRNLIQQRRLSVEAAAEEASRVLPMSDSAIKKHYLRALKSGMLAAR